MKKRLETGFRIFEWENMDTLCQTDIKKLNTLYENGEGYKVPVMPMQIHEVLIYQGIIEDPAFSGNAEKCTWVSEKDWIYMCRVNMHPREIEEMQFCRLCLDGVDTIVDLYWNGEKVASGKDVYLPLEAEIIGKCKQENDMILHVHSPHAYLRKLKKDSRYNGKIMPKWSLMRGFGRGYDDYLGYPPYLTRMGVYDEIYMDYGSQGIRELNVKTNLTHGGEYGCVEGRLVLFQNPLPATRAVYELILKGECVQRQEIEIIQKETELRLFEKNPLLWDIVQKDPYLYKFKVYILENEKEKDQSERIIGFRTIDKIGDFEFQLNGRPLKLWGANIAPFDQKSGCYQRERAEKIIKMALAANMNCLRIWGGTDRLPEEFYEMCDKAGLLLWQDFFHDYSMYPEKEEFRNLCKREVEYQVRRLAHHPSILLWCGSNESIMCRDFSNPGEECIGYRIYDEDYRKICHELDPERYYHMSSPSGGNYANDPLAGDTHSYTSNWFVPGSRYPVFLSENMRAYPPTLRSMKRMMGEECLWPEGELGQLCKGNHFPWPKTWRPFTSAESWEKISPVEEFYDANDAVSMIYRFGASVGRYIEDCVGRYRRGRSYEQREQNFRRCQGHLWWKMNTSAPHIYSGLLDYYMEPYIPYYALKRSYQPFQIFFSMDDYIGIWAVNDTVETICGILYVELFHLQKNTVEKSINIPFLVKPDESFFVTDLNSFGQFMMNRHILYARAVSDKGELLTEVTGYADIERHMYFPDCKIRMSWEGEELIVETDCFARSVELWGDDQGDLFGWEFSDNYFDLLPSSPKHIHVGGHRTGKIHAKGYYGTKEVCIDMP